MIGREEPWRRAADRRSKLASSAETTDTFRWLNGAGDGVPGITVDQFGRVGVLSLYRALSPEDERSLADRARTCFGLETVYLKRRPKEAHRGAVDREKVAPSEPLVGSAHAEHECRENGIRYRIRPGDGLAVGLYLDMRDGRKWVQERMEGRRLLNAFAYTCGFGVVARAGGAKEVVNLDASKRVLEWGRENLQLNGFEVGLRELWVGEAFDQLRRMARKKERFDAIVLDPPSFSAAKGQRFSAAKNYGSLVVEAVPLLSAGGLLFACCNLAELKPETFETQVSKSATALGRRVKRLDRLTASTIDFPLGPGEVPPLKIAAFTLD